MYDVGTDHQILGFGADRMHLIDRANGLVIVAAVRENGAWFISASGVATEEVPDRTAALAAMVDMALEVLPGEGYSTLIPRGLAELP